MVGSERAGTPARASILTALTVALAALSYHLVEKPVRYGSLSRFLAPRRMLVAVPLALGALFAISSSVVVPRAGAALGRVTRTIVLVGDSVPQRLAPDLARAAARYGYVVVSATRGSCPATGVAVVGVTGKPWGAGDVCATDVPARQDAAIARYRPALVIWWSRYELADRIDAHGRPVRFASPGLLEAAEARVRDPHTALTRDGAIVVAVQIERSGLGIATRCTRAECGPFLRRLIDATAAQAPGTPSSPRTEAARCGRSASKASSATTRRAHATTGYPTARSPAPTEPTTPRRPRRLSRRP